MRFGVHTCFLTLLVGGMFLCSGDSIAGELSRAANVIGDANCFGELQFTSHLGSVEFSNGETTQLFYQYSSFREYDSPHLGRGFFVPLLEATITDYDYFLEATTLGGGKVYLYRLPADPDRFVSLNGKNEAQKLGDNQFIRRTEDGFEMKYRFGKLLEVKTPGGARLIYEYDGDICRSIRSSSGAMVCTFGNLGNEKAVMSTFRGKFGLTFQEHPDSSDLDYRPEGTPAITTLESVIWPDRKVTKFTYTESDDPDVQVMEMDYDGTVMEAVWKKRDGRLVSCDSVSYEISSLRRDVDYEAEKRNTGAYSIKRNFPEGRWSSFHHDEDGGFSEYRDSEGTALRTHYINTRGPTFNLVRKRERIQGDQWNPKKPEVVYEAFYNTAGDLIREVRSGRVTWHLREGGLPISVVKDDDDFIEYDESERMRLSRFDGVLTRTQWSSDGGRRIVSKYPWGEVFLRYLDKDGNFASMPASEKFHERSNF